MAIIAVACSDKAEEPIIDDTVPLRPITPGFPPIRPRINADIPLMCNIKSGTMSIPMENGVKAVNVTFSTADSIVWECTATADKNHVVFSNTPYRPPPTKAANILEKSTYRPYNIAFISL